MLLHFTFDMPIATPDAGSPTQCGHGIYSDFHVNEHQSFEQHDIPERVRPHRAQLAGADHRVHDLGPRVVRPGAADVDVHADDVQPATLQLRAGQRWLRQPDPGRLRRLRAGSDSAAPGACPASARRRPRRARRRLQGSEHRLRSGGRRLRESDPELRHVHPAANMRGRRRPRPVRHDARLHAAHVPGSEDLLRSGGGRLRESDPELRHVHSTATCGGGGVPGKCGMPNAK